MHYWCFILVSHAVRLKIIFDLLYFNFYRKELQVTETFPLGHLCIFVLLAKFR